jgi:hypothetical protein
MNDVTRSRVRTAANSHHQGRFAGPVGTDQRYDLTGLNRQVNATQRLDRAVEGGHAGER